MRHRLHILVWLYVWGGVGMYSGQRFRLKARQLQVRFLKGNHSVIVSLSLSSRQAARFRPSSRPPRCPLTRGTCENWSRWPSASGSAAAWQKAGPVTDVFWSLFPGVPEVWWVKAQTHTRDWKDDGCDQRHCMHRLLSIMLVSGLSLDILWIIIQF